MRFIALILMVLSAAAIAGAPAHAAAMALTGCGMAVPETVVPVSEAAAAHHHAAATADAAQPAMHAMAGAHDHQGAKDPAPAGGHAAFMACAACLGLPARITLFTRIASPAERIQPVSPARLCGRDPATPFRPPCLTA